jgi:hypothetical protein
MARPLKNALAKKWLEGRDMQGRWMPGNSGRGNHVTSLKTALREAVTVQDVCEIMDVLVGMAKKGNLEAIRLFFDRIFGRVPDKPIFTFEDNRQVAVQLTNLSTEELKQMLEANGSRPDTGGTGTT